MKIDSKVKKAKLFFKKMYGFFLRKELPCIKAAKPIRGDKLVLTTKSREVLGTHLINLGKTKG